MAEVLTLTTALTRRWSTSEAELRVAVDTTQDPQLVRLWEQSQWHRNEQGHPCRRWADHIAALQVISLRRASRAITIRGRVLYLAVAEAAEALLAQAADVHGVRPSDDAVATLADLGKEARPLF